VYDIMTERYEITTLLQRELATMPGLFGMLETGSYDSPAVTKESVHHFSKLVSGSPLKRPAWFFDTDQQGEGIVDVTTHLVDLIQWECFPEQALDWQKDIQVGKARRWPTPLSPAQFSRVTQLESYPDYLAKDVDANGVLQVCANGEIEYTVRGIHAKVSVRWEFEAPAGAGDTHFSIMRGTKATLVIRQGAQQQYRPELYVEKAGDTTDDALESSVRQAIDLLQLAYPGVAAAKGASGWQIVIPDSYRTGHEAHFAQVTEAYLAFLADGSMPKWEMPNMLAKYYTTTTAYKLSR
jgi:predicted dehydrogenase